MRREKEILPVFAITNPNKVWVSEEIDKLIQEWAKWDECCQKLGDSPDYNPHTCSEAIKDGHENRRKHEVLREKTLVFLRNHFSGSEFILDGWNSHPYENGSARLKILAPYWRHRLDILKAAMDYVQVPDGYWKGRGKEFLETLSRSSAENAIEVASSYLKNPLGK